MEIIKAGQWKAMLITAFMLLAACTENPLRSRPWPTAVSTGSARATDTVPESAPVLRPETSGFPARPASETNAATAPVQIQEGSGRYLGTGRRPDAKKLVADDSGVSLNFKDMELQEFIKAVLGDILKENYLIDPSLTGKVTIQTVHPLPRVQIQGVLEDLLSLNGAAMIREAGRYRILPKAKAAQSTLVPRLRRLKGLGYGLQIVPLQYIGALEMEKILKPMLKGQGIVYTGKRRNLLILSGSEAQVDSLLETIAIFDVNWLAGKSVAMFPLQHVEAKTLVRELEETLGGKGNELFDGMVRLIPIERVNGLLVVSSTPAYMRQLQRFIERLDIATDTAGKRLYVYHLQNSKAADIATILNNVFSGKGQKIPRPVAEVMPAAQTVTLESSPTKPAANQTPESRPPLARVPNPGGGQGVALLGNDSVRIIADEINNALVILASAHAYKMVESTIRKLDILPKQVLIEATIIEVGLNGDLSYGVEWFFKNKVDSNKRGEATLDLGTGGIGRLAPSFSYAIIDGADAIRFVVNTLESESRLEVLSSPSLLVLDNKTAKISVGDDIPIPIRQSISNVDPSAPTVNEIQFRNTGIILTVTPRINAGGLVTMEITQEVSDAVGTSSSGLDAPTIQQRTIDTTVAVQSGEAVLLGGLIKGRRSDQQSGVPGLRRIPVIGKLFGQTSNEDRRTELLIVITPRVIGNAAEARAITEEYREKLSRPIEFDGK